MRITQGTFSFLPELTDAEISLQIEYILKNGWAVSVEYTDDPHPRNTFWEMWGEPMFDMKDAAGAMLEVKACRTAHAGKYIKVNAFDSTHGVESVQLSFMINRPKVEPGFRLERIQGDDRTIRYALHSYATDRPEGSRYG
jgi:ribulose-bisphosphate carboxylase small chain